MHRCGRLLHCNFNVSMMIEKESMSDNGNSLNNLIWSTTDVLLMSGLREEDYDVLLFLLSAYKDKIISLTDIAEVIERSGKRNASVSGLDYSSDDFLPLAHRLRGYYGKIYDIYESSLRAIGFLGIQELFKRIQYTCPDGISSNFNEIFDAFLFHVEKLKGKMGYSSLQPLELTRFIANFVSISEEHSIFNPFAGLASFALQGHPSSKCIAQEINSRTHALASLRLMAYGRYGTVELQQKNSIEDWKHNDDTFDFVFANPPLRMRMPHKEVYNTLESFLLMNGIGKLKPNGKLVAVVSSAFLSGLLDSEVRKSLIKYDLVESVIALPAGILYSTNVSLAIVVLSKKKEYKGLVQMVDASRFVKKVSRKDIVLDDAELLYCLSQEEVSREIVREIEIREIEENRCDLNISRYFKPELPAVTADAVFIPLDRIIKSVRTRSDRSKTIRPVMKISDLSDSILTHSVSSQTLSEKSQRTINSYVVKKDALLLSLLGNSLKPTLLRTEGHDVIVVRSIRAFRVINDIVDEEYLASELRQDYITRQLDAYRTKGGMTTIDINDLLSVQVRITNLSKQKDILFGRKSLLIKEKEDAIRQLKQKNDLDEADQLSVMRHKIAGRLANLEGAREAIVAIIENELSGQIDDIYHLKKTPNSKLDLGRYLEILERDLGAISNVFNRETEFKDKSEYERFDFIAFMKSYVDELKSDSFFSVTPSEEVFMDADLFDFRGGYELSDEDEAYITSQLFIKGDKLELRAVLDNFKDNAIKHAFRTGQNNKLNFDCRVFDDPDEISVTISNTGLPLPKGFSIDDFKRNGITSNKEGGDGYGGYYIDRVLKNHGGELVKVEDFTMVSERSSLYDYVTSFEFSLPIIDSDYDKFIYEEEKHV